jgi:hypothetical protein
MVKHGGGGHKIRPIIERSHKSQAEVSPPRGLRGAGDGRKRWRKSNSREAASKPAMLI